MRTKSQPSVFLRSAALHEFTLDGRFGPLCQALAADSRFGHQHVERTRHEWKTATPADITIQYRMAVADQPHREKLFEGWAGEGLNLLDIDDNQSRRFQHREGTYRPFCEMVANAHGVMVPTTEMARLVRRLNPNVFVAPNGLAATPVLAPEPLNVPLQILHARYFGEIDLIETAGILDQLFARFPEKISIKIIGLSQKIPKISRPGVKLLPPVPTPHYRRLVQQSDILWAHVGKSNFTRYKSDLKFFDAVEGNAVFMGPRWLYGLADPGDKKALLYDQPDEVADLIGGLLARPNQKARIIRNAHKFAIKHRLGPNGLDQRRSDWILAQWDDLAFLEQDRQNRLRRFNLTDRYRGPVQKTG